MLLQTKILLGSTHHINATFPCGGSDLDFRIFTLIKLCSIGPTTPYNNLVLLTFFLVLLSLRLRSVPLWEASVFVGYRPCPPSKEFFM